MLLPRIESVGTYRGAAEMCGVDPKTVKRKVLAHEAGVLDEERAERAPVPKNTDGVRDVVLERGRARRTGEDLGEAAVAGGTGGGLCGVGRGTSVGSSPR